MSKQNKILAVVIALFLGSILGVLGREIARTAAEKAGITRDGKRPSPSEIAGLVVAMNEAVMKPGHRFSNGVIFDGTSALEDTVVYSYHLEIRNDEVDPDWLLEIQTALPREYCTQMSAMVEGGVSAKWCYADNAGDEIICINSSPADCT